MQSNTGKRRVDLIDLFELAGIKVTPKELPEPPAPETVKLFPGLVFNLSSAIRAFEQFAKAMAQIGNVLAEPIDELVKAFREFIDIISGIPRQPARPLSPFEQALYNMERARCLRVNALQDRLLDVRY